MAATKQILIGVRMDEDTAIRLYGASDQLNRPISDIVRNALIIATSDLTDFSALPAYTPPHIKNSRKRFLNSPDPVES